MVEISIPQGSSVIEEALSKLVTKNQIEKYEYNYNKVYLYIKNFNANYKKELDISYRANYPENVTVGTVRVYDYYNPDVSGYSNPTNIIIE